MTELVTFLDRGGPALWGIALLSVLTLSLSLWKTWEFLVQGVWGKTLPKGPVAGWHDALVPRRDMRGKVLAQMLAAVSDKSLNDDAALVEAQRLAQAKLSDARTGFRALELVASMAPLIGLLGTVLGMIEAFQALQDAGSRPDPSVLAGGIWEALLTTAAGMAVAILATVFQTLFEGSLSRVTADLEDGATRLFVAFRGRV